MECPNNRVVYRSRLRGSVVAGSRNVQSPLKIASTGATNGRARRQFFFYAQRPREEGRRDWEKENSAHSAFQIAQRVNVPDKTHAPENDHPVCSVHTECA